MRKFGAPRARRTRDPIPDSSGRVRSQMAGRDATAEHQAGAVTRKAGNAGLHPDRLSGRRPRNRASPPEKIAGTAWTRVLPPAKNRGDGLERRRPVGIARERETSAMTPGHANVGSAPPSTRDGGSALYSAYPEHAPLFNDAGVCGPTRSWRFLRLFHSKRGARERRASARHHPLVEKGDAVHLSSGARVPSSKDDGAGPRPASPARAGRPIPVRDSAPYGVSPASASASRSSWSDSRNPLPVRRARSGPTSGISRLRFATSRIPTTPVTGFPRVRA